MQQDLFSWVSEGITQLLLQHTNLFQKMGSNLFWSFALINFVWFGVKSALSSGEGGAGFRFSHFADLLLQTSFGYAMITFYSAPIPGLGISFRALITDQAQVLMTQMNMTHMEDLFSQLTGMEVMMPFPTVFEAGQLLRVAIVLVALLCAWIATYAIISYGYVALGVSSLLGPLFIPFYIVPHMEWLFWGWFRCFIQYAFYPVIASAYVFVFGNVLLRFFASHTGPLTPELIALLFGPLVVVLAAYAYGVFKVPSLVYSIFSGRSGDYALPRLFKR